MNIIQTLDALERERQLLESFIGLSGEQLLLLKDEDLSAFQTLLQRRERLMMQLTDMKRTLTVRIKAIRTKPLVTPLTVEQMKSMEGQINSISDEIVRAATDIIEIDQQLCRSCWQQEPITINRFKSAAKSQPATLSLSL